MITRSLVDPRPALGDQPDGERIDAVLFGQHPGGEAFGVVVRMHRHDRLDDDRAVVHRRPDEVDGAAGEARAVGDHPLVHVQAAKRRQQRRVDVDQPVAPALDERRRSAAA